MAKVLQIIDVDADGHKVRLDDGQVIVMPHGGEHPHIGKDVSGTSTVREDSPNQSGAPVVPEEVSGVDAALAIERSANSGLSVSGAKSKPRKARKSEQASVPDSPTEI